ncbi:asparaginase [Arthrobacter crystallopoietes]|uniref:asparaginase n=1 Tax=Crystallibacter crystallopoietes TaxID=37928 RepID=A0A1H1C272_9MICC|nr:asparaginase [Arthrobacter crystallopoietes]AUI50910.1 L-asparaginase [Arthrobacter crystallopoietes]SDQ58264.1 L-asparaginase [Arthrobacter crystallopoietes]
MAHIRIFGTGGTIASRKGSGTGAVASDSAEDLLRGLSGEHTVDSQDILTTGSYRLGLGDLRTIAEFVHKASDDEQVDGVVITHGTDTMEETAFLLELVHGSPKTVVMTGAQNTADSLNPDGPRNLEEAVLAAGCRQLRGSGALISFSGSVRSARGARKAHTTAANPFSGGCKVAHMVGKELVVTGLPVRHPALPLPTTAFDTTRVEIITVYPGATTDLFDFAVASGAHAIVLAGSGVGNAGPGFADAIGSAVRTGCPVVLSTRTPWGPVVPTYGNGGGTDLVAAGAVPSGDLNPFQSRMLAALLLSHGTPMNDFPHAFSRYC